jgi:hypothetical protein
VRAYLSRIDFNSCLDAAHWSTLPINFTHGAEPVLHGGNIFYRRRFVVRKKGYQNKGERARNVPQGPFDRNHHTHLSYGPHTSTNGMQAMSQATTIYVAYQSYWHRQTLTWSQTHGFSRDYVQQRKRHLHLLNPQSTLKLTEFTVSANYINL